MTSDSDPTGPKDTAGSRRSRSKPTTIDLTAEEVAVRRFAGEPTTDAAQSQPAAGPTPASETDAAASAGEPPRAASVDTETEGLFVAAESPAASQVPPDGPDAPTPEPPTAGEDAASAEPVATPDSPVAAAEPPRRGFAGSLAAAVVGGLLVLAGGAGLYATGVIAPPSPPSVAPEAVSALDARIAEIDRRLSDVAAEPAAATDPALAERIGKLEEAVRSLPAAGTDPALASRIAELEETLKTAPVGQPVDVADLRSAIDALAARVDSLPPPPPDPAPRIDELAAAVTALQSGTDAAKATLDRLAAAPPPVDPARIDAIEKGVADLSGRLDTIDQALAGLNGTLAELRSAADASGKAADELGQRVGTIEERLDAGPKGGEIAALSLAVTTLASRVTAGEPFAADLAVVRQTAPDQPEIAALEPLAEAGVDTLDELTASLPVDAIVAARPVDPEAGVMDRVFSGAKSLVNYRETGAATSDPASAAIEGIRAGLDKGDLTAARTAAEGLPDWGKAAAADWLARLDRRIAAQQAVDALTQRVLARLQAPAEGQ